MIRTLAAALATSTCIVALATPAAAQTREYDIPAGSLKSALDTYVRQSGRQVVYRADQVRSARSPGTRGQQSAEAALAAILAGSGFTTRVDGNLVAIVKGGNGSDAARIASSSGDEEAENDIVVTGSNIRGVKDLAVPSTTITRAEALQGGFATVETLLEALPQNFGGLSADGRFSFEGGSRLSTLNSERAAGVDLRGLGAQSTLTLLNGQRRAGAVDGRILDISMIPLSIVERVEVVTGGQSAIYGADAVAGVVNFVTRKEFDGAETQAYVGTPTEIKGGQRIQASQLIGRKFDGGSIVAAYDFSRDWSLDLVDAGLLSQQPAGEIGITQRTLPVQSDLRKHTAYAAATVEPTSTLTFSLEGQYGHRRSADVTRFLYQGALADSVEQSTDIVDQYSLAGSASLVIGSWVADAKALHSASRHERSSEGDYDFGYAAIEQTVAEQDRASLDSVSLVASGPLQLGRIRPRIAFGVEYRREKFETDQQLDGQSFDAFSRSRDTWSVFSEAVIPMIGKESGVRRLELSVSARYDRYSDFGDTFNPQGGIIFEPIEGLTFKSSYSRAFRAPSLIELRPLATLFVSPVVDPLRGNTEIPVLFAGGDNPDLKPERATTWSAGIEYRPDFAPSMRASLSYFNVRYRDRIEEPLVPGDRPLALTRENRFPGLVNRNPSMGEVDSFASLATNPPGFIYNLTTIPWDPATQSLLDAFPDLVLFDNRTNNIAIERVHGIDVALDGSFPLARGSAEFRVNATYMFERERSFRGDSTSFSLLNEIGKPVDFKARLKSGWRRGSFAAFAFLNYTNGYRNPFSAVSPRISSWTTMDLSVQFNGSALPGSGFLSSVQATLSVENVFNNRPPFFAGSYTGILYDAANANARGRYVALNLVKSW